MRKLPVLLALAVSGCATAPVYDRINADGNTASFEQDKIVCRGEMQKANMSAREAGVYLDPQRGFRSQSADVYDGCMAARGWIRSN